MCYICLIILPSFHDSLAAFWVSLVDRDMQYGDWYTVRSGVLCVVLIHLMLYHMFNTGYNTVVIMETFDLLCRRSNYSFALSLLTVYS